MLSGCWLDYVKDGDTYNEMQQLHPTETKRIGPKALL